MCRGDIGRGVGKTYFDSRLFRGDLIRDIFFEQDVNPACLTILRQIRGIYHQDHIAVGNLNGPLSIVHCPLTDVGHWRRLVHGHFKRCLGKMEDDGWRRGLPDRCASQPTITLDPHIERVGSRVCADIGDGPGRTLFLHQIIDRRVPDWQVSSTTGKKQSQHKKKVC